MEPEPLLKQITDHHREIYDHLAEQYDQRVEGYRDIVGQTMQHLGQYLPPSARILDLGCGAGLCSELLLERGHQLTALDLSPAMTQATARRCPQAEVICADYLHHSFSQPFQAIVAMAFIHLFPAAVAQQVLQRINQDLVMGGLLYTGSSKHEQAQEGWQPKHDYQGSPARYRKYWTQDELEAAFMTAGFEIVDPMPHVDPFGKYWLDYVLRKVKPG